uniref:Uncharacterized protein n=1 Tax=Anopheles maculatus TaxID=74869 RepID=A0A182TBF1_9DIPT
MVSTQVNQGKEITYLVSLDCNVVVRYLLPGALLPLVKKMKTSEVVMRFEPDCDCVVDLCSFGVTLDMADVLSYDHSAADAQNTNVLNGNLRAVPARKETNKVMKLTEKSIPAKLTWLLTEQNRLTFRVCFDITALANTLPDPTYLLGLIRAAPPVPVSSSPLKHQFKTTVTGTREDSTGQRVHFSLRLNLKKILDMEVDDTIGDTSLDHNGNNATPATTTVQQEKQQPVASSRTTSNAAAETDTRPSKRFRFDVSRQF